MKIRVVFTTLATRTLTARAVRRGPTLVVTLGREASKLLMSDRADARDVHNLKCAWRAAAHAECARKGCATTEVYAALAFGGHKIDELKGA